MQTSEQMPDRKPPAARAWRALVSVTLAVAATQTEARPPQIAETIATGRDAAAPMAA